MGRDHRHRGGAGRPRRPARAAGATAPGWSSRSGRGTASCSRRDPPRRRLARTLRRRLHLRAAHRRRRVRQDAAGTAVGDDPRATSARYTRPAMTHVFVAPHPDDVALSCGGLIASLRELGQNVTILTVFSGRGDGGGLTAYQREALGFGTKTLWPATEAFNRATSRPTSRRAALARRGPRPTIGSRRPRPTPTPRPSASGSARRGIAGRASATSRSPARRSWTTSRPRARCTRTSVVEAATAGDDDGPPPRRGRAVRLLRRGVGRLPRPARRGLPRLRGRRRSCSARRATTTTRPFDAPARDRPTRAADGVPAARRRQPRRPPALPRRRRRAPREGRRWVMPGPDWPGIVVFYEDFPYAWWNDFQRLDDLRRRPARRPPR